MRPKPMSIDESIRRAQEEIAKWPPEMRRMIEQDVATLLAYNRRDDDDASKNWNDYIEKVDAILDRKGERPIDGKYEEEKQRSYFNSGIPESIFVSTIIDHRNVPY